LRNKSSHILKMKKKAVEAQSMRMFSLKNENFLVQNCGDDSWYFEDIDM